MTSEKKDPEPRLKSKKSSANFGLYAIVAVGLLYLVVRAVLYFTGGE